MTSIPPASYHYHHHHLIIIIVVVVVACSWVRPPSTVDVDDRCNICRGRSTTTKEQQHYFSTLTSQRTMSSVTVCCSICLEETTTVESLCKNTHCSHKMCQGCVKDYISHCLADSKNMPYNFLKPVKCLTTHNAKKTLHTRPGTYATKEIIDSYYKNMQQVAFDTLRPVTRHIRYFAKNRANFNSKTS